MAGPEASARAMLQQVPASHRACVLAQPRPALVGRSLWSYCMSLPSKPRAVYTKNINMPFLLPLPWTAALSLSRDFGDGDGDATYHDGDNTKA